jgi:hypothetical protein
MASRNARAASEKGWIVDLCYKRSLQTRVQSAESSGVAGAVSEREKLIRFGAHVWNGDALEGILCSLCFILAHTI